MTKTLYFRYLSKTILIFLVLVSGQQLQAQIDEGKPRLVVQITIDGLRYDMLQKYNHGLGDHGFRYFLDQGAVFSNTHYQHANTETIVGHTTLATGTTPAVHGMVGNVWYYGDSDDIGYNIEDPQAPILATRDEKIKGSQVDPSQVAARTSGRSPRSILSTTFGDELYKFHNGRSKIFGISGKDRSAVAMAGHSGKAFWFSTDTGDFITSSYYYQSYPDWVKKWNSLRKTAAYAQTQWKLSRLKSTYQSIDLDDRDYEVDLKGFGKTFPHAYAATDHPLFPTQVLVSPAGHDLLLDFGKSLITNEAMGSDEITDYLSISFSGLDAVNHFFGPSSLEAEEMIYTTDVALQELIKFIDEQVGLEHTLLVLSADHGMAEMPEYMVELGYEAGRLYTEDFVKLVDSIGKMNHGIEKITKRFYRPYLYLNKSKIRDANLDLDQVTASMARSIGEINGINFAVSRNQPSNTLSNELYKKVFNNYHPERSGDIYVVQEPYWFLYERGAIGVMHGSPYSYDTHVPMIFAGFGIKPAKNHARAHPADLAPTLAHLLGINKPSAATGRVLEVDFLGKK